MVPISKFGKCVLAIVGDRELPAAWLAHRAGCSVQHANRIIRGSRRVTIEAITALVTDIVGSARA